MDLLSAYTEKPKSKTLRYIISGVALVLLIAAGLLYLSRYTTEKHTVARFMNAVVAGDSQRAYQIWRPHPSFSYQDFIGFWGPNGYYSPIKSYQIVNAEAPPKSSGVVVVVEISGYIPFPKPRETVKFAQNREVEIWVERSDQSLSFPPP